LCEFLKIFFCSWNIWNSFFCWKSAIFVWFCCFVVCGWHRVIDRDD
jgi:hypothetical protein